MPDLMERIRRAIGMQAAPPLNGEQRILAERQDEIARRLKLRRESLDVQVDVLAADVRDHARKRK